MSADVAQLLLCHLRRARTPPALESHPRSRLGPLQRIHSLEPGHARQYATKVVAAETSSTAGSSWSACSVASLRSGISTLPTSREQLHSVVESIVAYERSRLRGASALTRSLSAPQIMRSSPRHSPTPLTRSPEHERASRPSSRSSLLQNSPTSVLPSPPRPPLSRSLSSRQLQLVDGIRSRQELSERSNECLAGCETLVAMRKMRAFLQETPPPVVHTRRKKVMVPSVPHTRASALRRISGVHSRSSMVNVDAAAAAILGMYTHGRSPSAAGSEAKVPLL